MNLIEVLQHYDVDLKKRGLEWWASCPFHTDNNPSFSVSQIKDKYLWHCFSCKRGGDKIKFIQELEHVSYRNAMDIYGTIANEIVSTEIPEEQRLLTAIIQALPLANALLSDRRIKPATVKDYSVGCCKDEQQYQRILRELEISPNDADTVIGLSSLADQIVYPYTDYGIVTSIAVKGISTAIYKTPKRERVLWGLDKIKGDTVYIMEGFHDVMVAHDYGIPAVAMSGTNMFDEYWKELESRNIHNVIFVPDGDEAGRSFLTKMVCNYPTNFNIQYKELAYGDPDEAILSDSFDIPEVYPIVWLMKNIKGDELSKLKLVAKAYRNLPDMEKVYFRQYIEATIGVNIIPYLYVDIPPNIDMERTVLANCIHSVQVRNELLRYLTFEHFHLPIHRKVFLEITNNDVVNAMYIKEVTGWDCKQYVDLINYKKYGSVIHDIYIQEKACIYFKQFKQDRNIGQFIENAYTLYDDGVQIVDIATIIGGLSRKLNDRVDNPEVIGIPFGEYFPILNRSLLGYVPTKFILVSGNTGHGKTTLICNWINDLITMDEFPLVVSLEIQPEELTEKILSMRTGIAGSKIMTGSLKQEEYDRIMVEGQELVKKRLNVVCGIYDLNAIVGIIKGQVYKNKIKVVFLDYLQLILSKSRGDRWEQLMHITQILKTQVCNALGVTLIAVSQLGKGALLSAVPDSSFISGSYGMLSDVDVAVAVKKVNMEGGSNFMMHIDKHRYNNDNVLIRAFFDRTNQIIKEIE